MHFYQFNFYLYVFVCNFKCIFNVECMKVEFALARAACYVPFAVSMWLVAGIRICTVVKPSV